MFVKSTIRLDISTNPGRLRLMRQLRLLSILLTAPAIVSAALTGWPRELVDWSVVVAPGVAGFAIAEQEPFFERPWIPGPGDKPYMDEQVPNSWLYVANAGMVGLVSLLPNSEGWLNSTSYRHLKASLQTIAVSLFVKELSKNLVGRPRPDYYNRLGLGVDLDEARKSWPSGHAIHAFNVATYLGLYVWDEWQSDETWVLGVKSGITALLGGAATWVAYTRVADNRHYVGDVLAGSVLGAGTALFFYSWQHWWGSPEQDTLTLSTAGVPPFYIPLVSFRF